MENVRRKERDSSATVSEEGTLVVRTRLRPPPLREDVVARRRLLDWLSDALHSHRLILISVPAGYGKTTLSATLPHAFPDLPGYGASPRCAPQGAPPDRLE